jgi:hypothetical protein
VNESSVCLVREDWADDVKSSLNELMATYGKDGTAPADSPYAVFDFDNTWTNSGAKSVLFFNRASWILY